MRKIGMPKPKDKQALIYQVSLNFYFCTILYIETKTCYFTEKSK